MSDTSSHAAAAAPTTASRTVSGERTAWWITFGVLTVAVVAMLGLWD
jgi:hypothetical protein